MKNTSASLKAIYCVTRKHTIHYDFLIVATLRHRACPARSFETFHLTISRVFPASLAASRLPASLPLPPCLPAPASLPPCLPASLPPCLPASLALCFLSPRCPWQYETAELRHRHLLTIRWIREYAQVASTAVRESRMRGRNLYEAAKGGL
jgi:hypothetical protein